LGSSHWRESPHQRRPQLTVLRLSDERQNSKELSLRENVPEPGCPAEQSRPEGVANFWVLDNPVPSNPRRPSRGQEFDVAHAMRTFLKQLASDAFRSEPRSLRSSSRTPMMPEPPNWSHLVDHCNRDPRRRQGTGNGDLQAAGRFDNHQVSGLKSPSQLADSGLVVGNCKALSVWPNSHVQLRIGPVDPDKPFCMRRHRTSSRCCPALQSGISFPSNRSGLITVKARRSSLIERVLPPRLHRLAAPPLSMVLLHALHTRLRKNGRLRKNLVPFQV